LAGDYLKLCIEPKELERGIVPGDGTMPGETSCPADRLNCHSLIEMSLILARQSSMQKEYG
jgi:hypothetical protein